jgi:hypothetical protein
LIIKNVIERGIVRCGIRVDVRDCNLIADKGGLFVKRETDRFKRSNEYVLLTGTLLKAKSPPLTSRRVDKKRLCSILFIGAKHKPVLNIRQKKMKVASCPRQF